MIFPSRSRAGMIITPRRHHRVWYSTLALARLPWACLLCLMPRTRGLGPWKSFVRDCRGPPGTQSSTPARAVFFASSKWTAGLRLFLHIQLDI